MPDDVHPAPAWVPDACTLPTAQQPFRLAEFDYLFATAVEQINRLGPTRLQLTLAGPPGLQDTVRDLAARENECCSFLAFTVAVSGPERLVFDIEVPDAYVEILDALTDRAGMARSENRTTRDGRWRAASPAPR